MFLQSSWGTSQWTEAAAFAVEPCSSIQLYGRMYLSSKKPYVTLSLGNIIQANIPVSVSSHSEIRPGNGHIYLTGINPNQTAYTSTVVYSLLIIFSRNINLNNIFLATRCTAQALKHSTITRGSKPEFKPIATAKCLGFLNIRLSMLQKKWRARKSCPWFYSKTV